MSTALHAQRIIEAWEGFNFTRFEAELEHALDACDSFSPRSALDIEERAVLETVVRQLRRFPLNNDGNDSYRLGAGFFLLRHLQAR